MQIDSPRSLASFLKLTPQGQILLKHTEKILPEVISTRKEINRSLAQYSTVGFPPIIIQYLFAALHEKDQFDFLKRCALSVVAPWSY